MYTLQIKHSILFILFIFFTIQFVHVYLIKSQKESFICGEKKLNKYDLWKHCQEKGENAFCHQYLPNTYLKKDIERLKKAPDDHFILKKTWLGMRKGLKLVSNRKDAIKSLKDYDIVQHFIHNPYLIKGFKLNLRYYLLVICGKGIYLYRRGICYYTPLPFQLNSLETAHKIAEGASVLGNDFFTQKGLPKTTMEFYRTYLTRKETNSLESHISILLRDLLNTTDLCCGQVDGSHLFGIDIELLENKKPILIEINSSPSLHYEGWMGDCMKPLLNIFGKNGEINGLSDSEFISLKN